MSPIRPIILGAVLVLSVAAGGCSSGRDDAGTKVDETVPVWVDQNGPFTCPSDAPVSPSIPPLCTAGPFERVRLSGHPLFAFLAEAGWQLPSEFGTWVGTARIVGRSVDDGGTVELDSIERT